MGRDGGGGHLKIGGREQYDTRGLQGKEEKETRDEGIQAHGVSAESVGLMVVLVCPLVDHFGPEWNTTTILWITMKFDRKIDGFQRMIHEDFSDPVTFRLAKPVSQSY